MTLRVPLKYMQTILKIFLKILTSPFLFGCSFPASTLAEEFEAPMYCVVKNSSCVAKIFGSIHMAPKNNLAVTSILMEAVDQADNIYFELAPYALLKISANDLISSGHYKKELRSQFEKNYKPVEVFNNEFKNVLVTSTNTDNGMALTPYILQIAEQRCEMDRSSGTEDSIAQKIAGTFKVIHSIESTISRSEDFAVAKNSARNSNQPQTSAIKKSSSPDELTDAHINKVVEVICQNLKDAYLGWKKSGNLLKNNLNKLTYESGHSYFATIPRNARIAQFLIDLIQKNSNPLVVIGYQHLYGSSGIISLLEKEGFSVQVLKK